jgi:hypothetical protein
MANEICFGRGLCPLISAENLLEKANSQLVAAGSETELYYANLAVATAQQLLTNVQTALEQQPDCQRCKSQSPATIVGSQVDYTFPEEPVDPTFETIAGDQLAFL